MHARIALIAAIAAATVCVTAVAASADATSVQGAPLIVTPAWAGIWEVNEETTTSIPGPHAPTGGGAPVCEGGTVTTRSYLDTLCVGDTLIVFADPPAAHGVPGNCYLYTGLTDTGFQLGCYGGTAYHNTCGTETYIDDWWDADWHLSGDVATTSATFSVYIQDCVPTRSCTKTTSTRTRISSHCDLVVPTRQTTWGGLKILYR